MPVESDGVFVISYVKLVANAVIAIVMVALVFCCSSHSFRRIRLRFGISTTLVLLATVATLCALNRDYSWFWGRLLDHVCAVGLIMGIWAVWWAIIELSSLAFRNVNCARDNA